MLTAVDLGASKASRAFEWRGNDRGERFFVTFLH